MPTRCGTAQDTTYMNGRTIGLSVVLAVDVAISAFIGYGYYVTGMGRLVSTQVADAGHPARLDYGAQDNLIRFILLKRPQATEVRIPGRFCVRNEHNVAPSSSRING